MSHSEFEEAITNLFKIGSLGLSKDEFDATPFGKSVKKIEAVIVKDMMPKVKAAHESDQHELNKLARSSRGVTTPRTRSGEWLSPPILSTKPSALNTRHADRPRLASTVTRSSRSW